MAKTFLQLVNDVVYESKVTLDPLTSVNFASPPRTTLYERIKRWVNQSYLELLNEKPEWFFTSERVVQTIQPRLKLVGLTTQTALGTLQVGDVITGQKSGVQFTINLILTTFDTGPVVGYSAVVDVTYASTSDQNDLLLNEKFSMKRGANPVVTDFGRIGGRGRYDFNSVFTRLLMEGQLSIQPSVDAAANPSPTDLQPVWPVNFMPWDQWAARFDSFASPAGRPIVITQAPDGTYEFYPRPDGPYDISIVRTKAATEMILFSDTPLLVPDKYQDYIMWRAVGEVADFNKDQALYSRAKKKWDRYFFWMMRDLMPKPKLDLTRFDLYPEGRYSNG